MEPCTLLCPLAVQKVLNKKIGKIFGGIKNCYIFVPVKSLKHFNHG